MDYTTLLLALIALALGGFFIGRERSVVLARSLPGGPRLHSLPGHYGYFVVIWSLLPALHETLEADIPDHQILKTFW